MVKSRRTKLDQEISRAQKNTRNKLYRLRKAGATNTAEFDPRKSRAERASMNGSQKAAYLRELRNFNSRDNRYYIQPENNVALPKLAYDYYRSLEKTANAARVKLRTAIETMALENSLEDLTEDIEFAAWATARVHPEGRGQLYIPATNKFHDLIEQEMFVGFSSIASLEKETKRAEKSIPIINRNRKQYRSWKKGIAAKMKENGYGDLAKAVRGLTMAQIDWLHYYTDFDTLVGEFRYASELDEGYSDLVDEDTISQLTELFDAARHIPRTVTREKVSVKAPKKPKQLRK